MVAHVLAAAFVLALGVSPAHAGDRGLYLSFADARGLATVDAARDALERAIFECGTEPLEACRTARAPNHANDTGLAPLYAVPPTSLDPALAQAALRSARRRRELVAAIHATGASLDALLVYSVSRTGAPSLALLNLNTGRVARFPIARDGSLRPGQRERLLRVAADGWVP